ncbi:MAG: hypothetical protein QGI45_07085, partial [Myxococcota bacterium]|nr:hypothetical protein [Myxococcota bacterium]
MSSVAPRSSAPLSPEELSKQQEQSLKAAAEQAAKGQASQSTNTSTNAQPQDDYRSESLLAAKNENTPASTEAALHAPGATGVTVSPSIAQASLAESAVARNSLEAGEALLAKGDWRKGIPKLNEAIRAFDDLSESNPFAAEEGRMQAFGLRTQAHLLQLSQAQSPERQEQVMSAIDQGFAGAKARLDKKMQAQSLPVNEQALYAEQQQKLQQLESRVKSLKVGLQYRSAAPLKDLADLSTYTQERAGRRLKALTRIWESRAAKAIKSSGLEVEPDLLTQHRAFSSHAAKLERDFGIDRQVFENIVAGTLKREKIEFIMKSHEPEAWEQARTDLEKIGAFELIPEAVLKAEFVQKKAEVIINKADVGAWGQVRADLEKFGAFELIPEAAFKAHFIQKKLQSTLQKAQDARARVGYYMLAATRHEIPSARDPYSKARSDDALAMRDLKALNKLMGGKLDMVAIEQNLQKVTTAGRDGWNTHWNNLKKEAQEAAQNRSTGQKALDILKGGVGAVNHTIESTLSLTVGNLAYLGGVDNAANYLNAQRQFFNQHAMGGSVFGGDEEFSNMQGDLKSWGGAGRLWSENFKTVNPLVHAGNVIMTPLNLADIPYDAYQKWVMETGSGVQLSEEEFRKLQAEDPLLRAGKASLNISKFALAAAVTGKMGKMTNIQLAKAIGVSSAFGTGGALAQELKSDQDFDTLRFAENSLAGAANSQMFMAGIGAMSTAWAKLRAGN